MADVGLNLDDELLKEFINESREHLNTIEADLPAIEEGGASIDVELVNKVFGRPIPSRAPAATSG